jgi:hypothetical protein
MRTECGILVYMATRRWVLGLVAAVASVVVATACSSSGSESTGAGGTVYFVAGADGWTLKRALKPAAGGVAHRAEPTLEWYAEHERYPTPERSQAVRLSGHRAPMAVVVGPLAGLGLAERRVRGVHARVGGGGGGEPAIVVLEVNATYTVMVLSYELGAEELVAWTNGLKQVDEAEWVRRGGVVE